MRLFGLPKHKKSRLILIGSVIFVLLSGMSVGGYYWYRARQSSQSRFLLLLSKYDSEVNLFKSEWPRLVSQAKSSLQFMMILKRLDAHHLYEEYKKTLVRALWKHSDVHSLLALAIDYKLSNSDGTIFDVYLNNVDELWNNYPNLVRLYYISLFEKNSTLYVGDDILNFYYNISKKQHTWETYNSLWQLTGESIFLFLAGIQANFEGEINISRKLYDSIPLEWQSVYSEYFEELAWIVKDIVFLRPLVESQKDSQQYAKLAEVYIASEQYQEAYVLLKDYIEIYPVANLSPEFLHVYLWLSDYFKEYQVLDEVKDIIFLTRDIQLSRHYLIYQYKQAPKEFPTFVNKLNEYPKKELLADSFIQFLILNSNISTVQQQQAFFWNKIYDWNIIEEAKIIWYRIAAAYFLQFTLLEDFDILQDNSKMEYVLLPYIFFYNIKYNKESYIEKQNLQKIVIISETEHYQWWHYYNLGLFKLNSLQYEASLYYFDKALRLVEQTQPRYKVLILSQLVRLSLSQGNLTQAELNLTQLQALFPTNTYGHILEKRIEFLKNQQEDRVDTLPSTEDNDIEADKLDIDSP